MTTNAPNSDDAIVRRVLTGDVDAFEVLIDRHTEHVMRIVARNVPAAHAPETGHEAFVSAYLSLSTYRKPGTFERWLARIALRACAGHWRREYRDRDRHEPQRTLEKLTEPFDGVQRSDDREFLDRALARISLEDRQVLTLVYFEGLSVRECAAVLGGR